MRIRRRRLRSALVFVGCVAADVPFIGADGDVDLRIDSLRLAAVILLLAAGALLHFASKACLEQNQRLVTAGPYRFTRNPFYLANLLVDLGLCALIGRVGVAVPYVAFWWLAYRATIAREEERLAALFPVEVARYFAVVPRLIPNGRVLRRAEAVGRFALDNPALAQGSEYARILGFGVAAAAIAAAGWLRAQGRAALADEHSVGLALALLVPVAWVAKLALAELFRRPQTAFLPFARRLGIRHALSVAFVAAALAASFCDGSPVWQIDLAILWGVLAGFDGWARSRSPSGAQRPLWNAFSSVAIVAFAVAGLVEIASRTLR